MSIGSAIKGNISGALGNIERAIIMFPQQRGKINYGMESNASFVYQESQALSLASKKLNSNKLGTTLGELDSEIGKAAKGAKEGKIYMVQFNPATIRINAVGGGNFAVTSYSGNAPGASFQKLDARIDVSMTLILDAVNNKEAFGQDKLIVEPVEIAKGVAAAAATAAGKNYSVLQQVEGFHAAMRVMDYTNVKFIWAGSVLEGGLTRVNSRYTMFSPTGNPIRAEMGITITCQGAAVKKWKEAYEQEFAGKEYMTTQKTSQTLSGLVNI